MHVIFEIGLVRLADRDRFDIDIAVGARTQQRRRCFGPLLTTILARRHDAIPRHGKLADLRVRTEQIIAVAVYAGIDPAYAVLELVCVLYDARRHAVLVEHPILAGD